MFKKLQTIYQLKKIRQKKINHDFLASLRISLIDHMKANPVTIDAQNFNLTPFNLFQPKYAMALAVMIIAVFGGGGMAFASQGSLPGEKLYPVKTLVENTRLALTVRPEAKERLAIDLAAKRVAEIKTIMEKKNGDLAGLDIALSRLEKNMRAANNIINKEKASGRDITAMANDANENFNFQERELEKIFKTQKDKLIDQMKTLENKIELGKTAGTSTETEILTKQLENIKIKTDEIITAKEKTAEKISEQKKKAKEKTEKHEKYEKPEANSDRNSENIESAKDEKRETEENKKTEDENESKDEDKESEIKSEND